MRRGGKVLVVLGLLLGAITAGGVFVMLMDQGNKAPEVPTKMIVVAAQNIAERSLIPTEALELKAWPENALPPQYLEKTTDVAGKMSRQLIYQGQIVMPVMIIDTQASEKKLAQSPAAFSIPSFSEGDQTRTPLVAIAFAISEITGVSNALQAGDYVDILLTLQATQLPSSATTTTTARPAALTGNEGLPVTQMMLQNVLIIQIGAWSSGAEQKNAAAGTITFALNRQDALALKSAREQGQIDLVLRRAGDKGTYDHEAVTLQYLNKRFKFNLLPIPNTRQ